MNLLLIDLDDTLIDVSGFKKYLFSQLSQKCSIPEIESLKHYQTVKLLDRWPELFLNKLHEQYGMKVSELQEIFSSCFSQLKLNEKTLTFLRNFEGKKYIFSFGTHDFQMQKITYFHLEKEVDGILITLENKADYLERFIKQNAVVIDNQRYSHVTMIDNKEELLEEVKKRFPWIQAHNVTDTV